MSVNWSSLLDIAAKAAGLRGIIIVMGVLLVAIIIRKAAASKLSAKGALALYLTLPLSAFILFAFVLWMESSPPPKNIGVALQQGGDLLREHFTVSYSVPNQKPLQEEGRDGHAEIRDLPPALDTLRIIDVRCPGYVMETKPPHDFEITDRLIKIQMIQDIPADPEVLDSYPSAGDRVPSRSVVFQPSPVLPKSVSFKYKNLTGRNARLALYSCAAHYQQKVDGSTLRPKWLEMPFPASSLEQIYESFDSGSGWFVFYIQLVGSNKWDYLDTKCLFTSADPLLVVRLENGKPVSEFSP